tara:strand:+ start:401 stop:637 length:237 start_codon:yes stop_codon:yes gene_type:complete
MINEIKSISDETLQYQPFKDIALNRTQDIKLRGAHHKVHDYNGKVVTLESACVWYNNDGNYVEPRTYEETLCNICIIN